MRASFKSAVIAALAIGSLAAVSIAPAAANPAWHHGGGGGGGWHHGGGYGGGYGGGWHHHGGGGGGWVGPAIGLGIVGGLIAAGAANCYRYVPVYDDWGNYVGRRTVNTCY